MTPTITQDQIEHRRQEVVQAIDNACNQMRSEGVQPHNYVEQLSWLFFLKAFDESESRREEEADVRRDGIPTPAGWRVSVVRMGIEDEPR